MRKLRSSRTRTASKVRKTRRSKARTPNQKRRTHRSNNTHSKPSPFSRSSTPAVTVVATFPTTVTGQISVRNTGFVSAKAITATADSDTAGYSFGFVDAWPSNWLYTQDVYVIEINGMYFLCHAVEHHGYL